MAEEQPQADPRRERRTRALSREEALAGEVEEQYIEAYLARERLNLHERWLENEEYYHGEQVKPEDEHDPASNTNIIAPIIDGIVAELATAPTEILLQGWTRSDIAVAPRAQRALEWIWKRNRMDFRRDEFEYCREIYGTGIWKVFFDGTTGRAGMPRIEPVSPFNFFPDPRVRDPHTLHTGEYVIHAVPRPIPYLKRVPEYADAAARLRPGYQSGFEPDILLDFPLGRYESEQVLVLERWTIEPDGHLRKVVTVYGQPVVLYDSDEDARYRRGYLALDRFPFVVVPCYRRRGSLWGVSDVDRLKPTQDIINDLDDQIRLNARLMGNLQIVVDVASGIDPFRWTNQPGLKIPARDPRGFQIVQPQPLPSYIENRRTAALTFETEFISGRTDVVEGRRPGSLRAASAILALQEAASKRINHKRMNSRWGLEEAFSIVLDLVTQYWTEEVEIGEELAFRGSELRSVPILDERGQPTGETKRAEFDIVVHVGEGMPTNKAFVYQAVIEGLQFGLLTREEARAVLKQTANFPIINPWVPEGTFPSEQPRQPGLPTSETMSDRTGEVEDQLFQALVSGVPPSLPG